VKYLESKISLDLLSENLGNVAIKIVQNFHRKLRRDAPFGNKVIQRVGKRHPYPIVLAPISTSPLAAMYSSTPEDKE
jgi:hypothetical protein